MQEVQRLMKPASRVEGACAGALCGFDEALLGCNDSDMCLTSRRYIPCTGRSDTGALVMGLAEKLNQSRQRQGVLFHQKKPRKLAGG
jgi:hypothetical protein